MRGIAASRIILPPDLDTTVNDALRMFDKFIETWVGSGAHAAVFNSPDTDKVRDAITAVGRTAHRDRVIGQAVFKISYCGENRSRMQYDWASPIFEEDSQPLNALKAYRDRRDGHYEILAVVEPL